MNEVTKYEILRIETVALADIAKDIEHQLGQRAREPNVRPKANDVQPHHDVRVPEYNSQKSVSKRIHSIEIQEYF
jgi:hypothetical protein